MQHSTHTAIINGIKVLFISIPNARATYITLDIFSGFRFALENEQYNYHLPHVLEHLVFEGSAQYPSGKRLTDELGKGGAYYNGFTNNYTNQYVIRTTSEHAHEVLPVLMDMVYHPLLEEARFNEERVVIARELEEQIAGYNYVAYYTNLLQSIPGAGLDLLEQLNCIDAIQLEDVKKYHEQFYTAKNTCITISGAMNDATIREFKKQLRNLTKDIPEGTSFEIPTFEVMTPARAVYPIKTSSQISTLNVSLSFTKEGRLSLRQTQVYELFSAIVGAAEEGSVFYHLRKAGLLYSLDCMAGGSVESHDITLNFACDKGSYLTVLSEVLVKLRAYTRSALAEEYVAHVKDNMAGSLLIGCETATDYQNWYGPLFLFDEALDSPEEIARSIHEVSAGDIQEKLGELITNENLHIAIMGGNAHNYVRATEVIRKQVFELDSNAEEASMKAQVMYKRDDTSQPIGTWFVRVGMVAVTMASFIPSLIDKSGATQSLWTLGLTSGYLILNIMITIFSLTTLITFVTRFNIFAKAVFWITAIYYGLLIVAAYQVADSNGEITGIFEEIAVYILLVMPIFILAITLAPVLRSVLRLFLPYHD